MRIIVQLITKTSIKTNHKKIRVNTNIYLLILAQNNVMRISLSVIAFLLVFASCENPFNKTISGNGTITTSERNLSSFKNIKCAGSYEVELTQGNTNSVKIETDENLQSYIITDINGDELNIHTQKDLNLHPSNKIKLYITMEKLEEFKLTGSGNVSTTNKLTGGDHLDLDIAGSGNMHFDVNTPTVNSSISGTGDIYLTGETRDSKIEIAGSGNYHAEDLKAENATVKIAGSGDARVFADSTLDINIAGVGNVYYKGSAAVSQNVAGSGKIKKLE
jgi:Putative auto-transporter adhesin, head GIN domain